jgi:hypothetical protein
MNKAHEIEGEGLIPPQVVAVEQGRQEMLKASHIKVNSNYFAIDPNLDFDASTILCEDRVYTSDQTPDPTQPLTWTIQPQFNVFRSLSESRFVFLLNAVIGTTPVNNVGGILQLIPKPYWSALFVNNIVININNVAVNDQHSRTTQYAHFVKTVLTEGNLKNAYVQNPVVCYITPEVGTNLLVSNMYGAAGEDIRTLSEGIINTDYWAGLDEITSYHNLVLATIAGFNCTFLGNNINENVASVTMMYVDFTTAQVSTPFTPDASKISIELTYRPRDGIWQQPKLLPPGVNLNFVLNLNTLGTWCNGYTNSALPYATNGVVFRGINPDTLPVPYTYTIVRAQYYERQYTSTQTLLKSYQSLIMRQPLYFSCLTSNTLLFPVSATQTSVQLTNVFSGRLPNLVVVALLNQSANTVCAGAIAPATGNINQLLTYSPLAGRDRTFSTTAPPANLNKDCINSVVLTVNGRVYPHLWSSNMAQYSNQDLSQWYEQYRQCSLVCKGNGRQEVDNLNLSYKMDTPLLSFGEFKANFTLCCFNIRRNGTVIKNSGDKEVGGIDMLVNIAGNNHPGAQLMVVGVNTDSLMTITDGGSTTSFVF